MLRHPLRLQRDVCVHRVVKVVRIGRTILVPPFERVAVPRGIGGLARRLSILHLLLFHRRLTIVVVEGHRVLRHPHRRQRDVCFHRLFQVIRFAVQQPPRERVALSGGLLLHLGILDRLAVRHRCNPPPATVRKPPFGCVELHLPQLRQLDRVWIRVATLIYRYLHRVSFIAFSLS